MDDKDAATRDIEAELAKSQRLLAEVDALMQRARYLILEQQKLITAVLENSKK